MSSETIGSAFLQIIPSFEGIGARVTEGLAPLSEKSEEEGDKASKSFFDSFSSSGARLAGVAGVALGGLLTKGFLDSIDQEAGNDKLAGQLGIQNPDYAKSLGKIAGKVYAGNFGESLPEVNEALKNVLQGGLLPEDAADADIQKITEKALTLSSVFGEDLSSSTRAVSTLIKTGLVKNADEGFDVLTRGFQNGANISEDFLDTMTEYPTLFRNLGLNGAEATGILSQGLKAGARDGDKVADALKEFSIRAVDGSKLTSEGFQALGLDAGVMAQRIANGGDQAKGALQETLDKLKAIPDPVKRSQVAVALFGTQAEDLGKALFAIDPSKATRSLGEVAGAADQLAATVGDNTQSKLESFKRKFELAFSGIGSQLGPVLSVAPAIGGLVTTFGALGPILGSVASGFGSVASGAASLVISGAKLVATTVAQTAAWIAQNAVSLAAKAATAAYTAVQWLLNAALTANPIGIVIAALAALVAGAIYAYTHFDTFRNIIDKFGDAFQFVFNWIKDNWPTLLAIITGPIGVAVLLITKNWDTIKDGVSAMIDFVKDLFNGFVDFIKALPRDILNALGDFGGLLVSKGRDLIVGLFNGYVGAYSLIIGEIISLGGKILSWIGDFGGLLVTKGINLIQGLYNGIVQTFYLIGSAVGGIGNAVLNGVGDLGSILYDAGVRVVRGFINGIGSMFGAVKDKLGDLTSALTSWKGPPSKDSKILTKNGQLVIQGFIDGLESYYPKVQQSLAGLTTDIGSNALTFSPAGSTGLSGVVGAPGRYGAATGPSTVVTLYQTNNSNASPEQIARATTSSLATAGVPV